MTPCKAGMEAGGRSLYETTVRFGSAACAEARWDYRAGLLSVGKLQCNYRGAAAVGASFYSSNCAISGTKQVVISCSMGVG